MSLCHFSRMDVSDCGGYDTSDEVQENAALKPASIVRIVDLTREYCTAAQWGEWLKLPLESAAAEGNQELTEELLVAGARGDPISAALRAEQGDLVHHLLELDQEPTNLQDHHLHLAVELEDEAFVAYFLRRGLKPHEDDLLRLAVTLGNEAIVSLLLKHGSTPDGSPDHFEWDEKYSTPLLIAAREGHAGVLRLLLDAGALVARRLSTTQQFNAGSDTEENTLETESALELAAIGGHVDVIEAILERDPSLVNQTAPSTGNTALLYAVKHHRVGAVDALVEAGADLEAFNNNGRAALHLAARCPDDEPILRTLLRRGAKMDPTDGQSMPPLAVAVQGENHVGTDMLISAGADVNKSLLAVSRCSNKDIAMIRTLLAHGADVNTARARDGSTPLHLACNAGFAKNVKLLLEADADETAVNLEGQTPADVVHFGTGIRRFSYIFLERPNPIHALLANAPSEKAWRRRALFALCRTFPCRVRFDSPPCGRRDTGERPTASTACSCPVVSRAKKATKANGTARENPLENPGTERPSSCALGDAQASCNFTAAMDRLVSLQPDEVFRKIVGLL